MKACIGTAAMEVYFSVGIHMSGSLLFSQLAGMCRLLRACQYPLQTYACSVGAVSTTTSELVELLGETQKADAKGYS